jgi:hypothetical protein
MSKQYKIPLGFSIKDKNGKTYLKLGDTEAFEKTSTDTVFKWWFVTVTVPRHLVHLAKPILNVMFITFMFLMAFILTIIAVIYNGL